jgi:Flp pilus assembly protein TadB
MPRYDPSSTKSFKEQMLAAFRLDEDLDDVGRAGVQKSRVRFLAIIVIVACLVLVLSGAWVALVVIAAFAVPLGGYWAWVLSAQKDPPEPGARR